MDLALSREVNRQGQRNRTITKIVHEYCGDYLDDYLFTDIVEYCPELGYLRGSTDSSVWKALDS